MTAKWKSATVSAALVSNEEANHASTLRKQLATATRFTCVVAFAKLSGFSTIKKQMKARIAAGMSATFVVGIDFFQTEPALLRELLKLKKSADDAAQVSIYMGAENHEYTMHPKIYLLSSKQGLTAIVGSANMTQGGFEYNHEFSAVISGHDLIWENYLNKWIVEKVEEGELVEVEEDTIERYAVRRARYLPHMQMAEKKARKAVDMPGGSLDTLHAILATMKEDEGETGFDSQVAIRANSVVKAAAVLQELAMPRVLSEDDFLERYEKLVSGLWHSGGLHRAKTTIAENAGIFQEALRALNANESNEPGVLFEQLRNFMRMIPRAGVNVITEILHTRDNTRFPVMNRNSVSGMRMANITRYPEGPTKALVDGATYASFCADAEKIRVALGLKDFSELDALFNYAYWGTD